MDAACAISIQTTLLRASQKENIMRLLRNSVHGVLVLAAIAVALAPTAVFADHEHAVPITGTFTMATVVTFGRKLLRQCRHSD